MEKAKRALSASHQVRIEIESFFEGEDFSETLTRAKFEELNMDLFRSTLKPVQKVYRYLPNYYYVSSVLDILPLRVPDRNK